MGTNLIAPLDQFEFTQGSDYLFDNGTNQRAILMGLGILQTALLQAVANISSLCLPLDRITVAQPFAQGNIVWANAIMLKTKLVPGTFHIGRHFIGDDQTRMFSNQRTP